MKSHFLKRWWRNRFVTLMVIPERTRTVRKLVIPFFLVKAGIVLASLGFVLMIILGFDYVHVISRIAENKRLKGENFRLRQEIQLIRNKVDSMETTLERVSNYAKKLQLMTGDDGKQLPSPPTGPIEPTFELPTERRSHPNRKPTGEIESSKVLEPETEELSSLGDRVEELRTLTGAAEASLSLLQSRALAQSAMLASTPTLLPLSGWLSSSFGYRRHPYDGSYRFHSGVDIAAEPGTPVRAPAEGSVMFAGYREGYGKVVVINHGYGITTLFAHNSKLFTAAGVRVKRGEIISQVGSTGQSTGPHLHYEIRKNGMPVNPATFFSKVRF